MNLSIQNLYIVLAIRNQYFSFSVMYYLSSKFLGYTVNCHELEIVEVFILTGS